MDYRTEVESELGKKWWDGIFVSVVVLVVMLEWVGWIALWMGTQIFNAKREGDDLSTQ
jgi:hypothetical protein